MTSRTTITFSQEGVQPPVYVVTSLSEPPWEPLEMHVDRAEAENHNLVFSRSFQDVAAGTYQYKIRIGEGHWVVDDSRESGTDDHGNKNNVVHVEPVKTVKTSTPSPDSKAADSKTTRKDSSVESDKSSVPSVPVPFVVVEKVPDKEQPEYGDTEPSTLPVDEAKRTADAEPDLVKAKSDDGSKTGKQELDIAPLLRHESDQAGRNSTTNTTKGDTTDSSTHRNSVSSVGETAHGVGELKSTPLLQHELETEEGTDELSHGPLLAHESSVNGDLHSSEGEGDELDVAPLLPHETGFSQSNAIDPHKQSTHPPDNHVTKLQQYAVDDEYDSDDYDPEDDAPLLPHERDSAVLSQTESDHGDDDLHIHRQNSHGIASENSKQLFGQPTTFRTRNDSSTLPHRMPISDAEDENLHDPSLEQFPTDRAHILDRVASIGLQLPEDQTIEETIHSPVISVFSQSASSTDLVPVKSYASLASVPEGDDADEGAEDDIESLPSPVVRNFQRSPSRFARSPSRVLRYDDEKRIEASDRSSSRDQKIHSRKAEKINENDFAKDKCSETVQNNLEPTSETPASVQKSISKIQAQDKIDDDSSHLENRSTHKNDDSAVTQDGDNSNSARIAVIVVGVAALAYWFFGAS